MSGIPSWAVRGAKVVCIDGAERSSKTVDGWAPKTGGIYTIRSTFFAEGWNCWYLRLEEYVADGVFWRGIEPGWDLPRFRPLITEQDDLETHFKALLDVPEQVGA